MKSAKCVNTQFNGNQERDINMQTHFPPSFPLLPICPSFPLFLRPLTSLPSRASVPPFCKFLASKPSLFFLIQCIPSQQRALPRIRGGPAETAASNVSSQPRARMTDGAARSRYNGKVGKLAAALLPSDGVPCGFFSYHQTAGTGDAKSLVAVAPMLRRLARLQENPSCTKSAIEKALLIVYKGKKPSGPT